MTLQKSRSVFSRKPRFGLGDEEPWATDPPMLPWKSRHGAPAKRPQKDFCLRSTKSLVSEWWAMPPRSPHERSPKISTNEMISLAVALLLPPANFVGFEALQRSEWVGDTSHVKEWLTGIHGMVWIYSTYLSTHPVDAPLSVPRSQCLILPIGRIHCYF